MNTIVISKPNFSFIITESKLNRRSGTCKRTVKIMRVKNNSIEVIDTITYTTGSFKGDTSEVYTALYNKGYVPEGEYLKSNGYYPYSDSAISIKEIY